MPNNNTKLTRSMNSYLINYFGIWELWNISLQLIQFPLVLLMLFCFVLLFVYFFVCFCVCTISNPPFFFIIALQNQHVLEVLTVSVIMIIVISRTGLCSGRFTSRSYVGHYKYTSLMKNNIIRLYFNCYLYFIPFSLQGYWW